LNDNSPYCEYQIYTVETIQNADINTTLLQIKGLDKDIGKNSIISYSLKLNNESKDKGIFIIIKLSIFQLILFCFKFQKIYLK
jgi:hypothetical protein